MASRPAGREKNHLGFNSWLNQTETWFSILQGQSLNGASFTTVGHLQENLEAFIAAYNETADPFA